MAQTPPSWGLPALWLDASGDQASVCLVLASGQVSAATSSGGQHQADGLMAMAWPLLQAHGLTWQSLRGLGVCHGPGSFTGLRIACGLVQGLSLGLGLPVVQISRFEAMAYALHQAALSAGSPGLRPQSRFIQMAFDARLGEAFRAGLLLETSPRAVRISEQAQVMPQSLDEPDLIHDPSPMTAGPAFATEPGSASLAGWAAALLCWELGPDGAWPSHRPQRQAADVQPLYVREEVAQTIAQRQAAKSLRLEPLDRSELDAVLSLEVQAYPFPWSRGNFEDSFDSGYRLLKLVDQGVMVGYLVWMQILDEAHLLNFTIAPGRQRRGLGQWMLQQFMAQLAQAGLVRLMLEVRPSNETALRLYQRNGFEQIGLRRGYYPDHDGRREDARVMARALSLPKSTPTPERPAQ